MQDPRIPRSLNKMSTDRFRLHTIPAHTHPLVRELIREMNEQQCTYKTLSKRTGMHQDTIRRWRDQSMPRINDLEACFNALGKQLKVTDIRENRL